MTNTNLSAGKRAPAFTVPATGGERVRLTEYRGYWVVLFFYGKDGGVHCSKIMKEFCVHHGVLTDHGAMVFGIGPGTTNSHEQFADDCELPFDLLVDHDNAVARKYGVWREKRTQGRRYMGLVRSTFIIDPSGKVVRIFDNVRTKNHGNKVVEALLVEMAN
ncbi:MAG: peroxiredoxin [Planctomycetota bacterium]|nr:MAG: peroxiredoxin [Planctomycetota bacterium]